MSWPTSFPRRNPCSIEKTVRRFQVNIKWRWDTKDYCPLYQWKRAWWALCFCSNIKRCLGAGELFAKMGDGLMSGPIWWQRWTSMEIDNQWSRWGGLLFSQESKIRSAKIRVVANGYVVRDLRQLKAHAFNERTFDERDRCWRCPPHFRFYVAVKQSGFQQQWKNTT